MEPITKNDYAKMFMGYKPGDYVPPEVEAQIDKELEYYRKEALKAKLAASQAKPAALPEYVSLTNKADNSVVRGIMEDGKFREIPADKIHTPQGTFTMQSPTNAAPIYLPNGAIAQNYTSEAANDVGSSGIGQYGQTNNPASPPQTNAPVNNISAPTVAPRPMPTEATPQQGVYKVGAAYMDAKGNRRVYTGANPQDPLDPRNWQ